MDAAHRTTPSGGCLGSLAETDYLAAISQVPDHIRNQVSQLFVLFMLNRQLNATFDPTDVLGSGSRLVGDLLEVEGVALHLVDDRGGDELVLFYVDPRLPPGVPPMSCACERGLLGRAMALEGPLLVHGSDTACAEAADLLQVPPGMAVLAQRILGPGREPIGVITFYRAQELGFGRLEVPFFAELAQDMGRALARARALEAYRRSAICDDLTGLYNRVYVREQLEQSLDAQRRYSDPLSVVLIDVDHFKAINDTHGHAVGDEVLRETAVRIRRELRESDTVGRYGGEEFLVVLPRTCADAATRAAEKIRGAVAREPVPAVRRGVAVPVTVSLGIATAPDDGQEVARLLEVADQRLYAGKAGGRNRVVSSRHGRDGGAPGRARP